MDNFEKSTSCDDDPLSSILFIFYVKMILKSLGKNNHYCQFVWWMMLCEKKTKNTNQKKNQNKIQLAKNRLPSVIY